MFVKSIKLLCSSLHSVVLYYVKHSTESHLTLACDAGIVVRIAVRIVGSHDPTLQINGIDCGLYGIVYPMGAIPESVELFGSCGIV